MRIQTRHTKNRTKLERHLQEKGYVFGHYTNDKAQAKAKAAEFRAKGYFATVSAKTYVGRVYNTEGYTVYIKPKANKAKQ